jgi:hypothetical protein
MTRDERALRAVLLTGESYWTGVNLLGDPAQASVVEALAACVDAEGEPLDIDRARKLLRDGLESLKATSEALDGVPADGAPVDDGLDEEVDA